MNSLHLLCFTQNDPKNIRKILEVWKRLNSIDITAHYNLLSTFNILLFLNSSVPWATRQP